MEKLALVLFGSPHKNGFTTALLSHFLNHLKLKNYKIKLVDAYKKNVHPCTDCCFCKSKEGCTYDDIGDVDYMLKNCDLLIIASPIYNASFPAPLKAIFDRFQRYFNAKYELGKVPHAAVNFKKAITLLTQGSEKISYEEVIKKQLNPIFRLLNADCFGQIIWTGTDNKNLDIDNFLIKGNNKIQDIINKL